MKGFGFLGGVGGSVLAEMRCTVHKNISSELLFCKLLLRKKIPQDRNVAQSRNFVIDVGNAVVHESGDHKTLSVLQFKFSFGFAGAEGGDGKSGDGQRIGKVQRAHLRSDFQVNISVGHDYGRELQAHSEVLERDGHSGKTRTRLHDGKRELTPGQKAGFLAVDGNQVGFGEDLQQILGFKSFNGGSEINIGPKEKKIEDIIEGGRGRGGGGPAICAGSQGLRAESAELPGRRGADRIRASRGNEVDPELREDGTVHFRELYLQQNFLRSDWPEGEHIYNFGRIGAGQFAGAFGDILGGNVSRKHDRGA